MSQLVPTATGTFEATPLGHLLVYALDRELNGTLVLEQPSGEKHAIFFDRGAPAKVKTQSPVIYLGDLLLEFGLISDEVRRQTLDVALSERHLHGQVLVAGGHIQELELREALREQLSRQVLWMFRLPPRTAYGYFDRVNLLERWGAPGNIRVKPLALIWRGMRAHANPEQVASIIARLGEQVLTLHIEAPLRRFRFEPQEQAIIDVLRAKPQPLAELLRRDLADPDYVRRLVYALVVTRQLETGLPGVEPIGLDEAPSSSRIPISRSSMPVSGRISTIPFQRSMSPPAPQSHPPSSQSSLSSRTPAARSSSLPAVPAAPPTPRISEAEIFVQRQELKTRAERSENHYEVLGVKEDATSEQIQAAFFKLAKKWHPDRLGPEFADVRDLATSVFARITEAQQLLSDPARRKEYDQKLKQGAGTDAQEAEQVQRVVRALTAFQKAQVLLKRNNLAAAEEEARCAAEADPSQAEYGALYAWLLAQRPNANLEDQIKALDRAALAESNNTRIRWYRGQLLKRLGREDLAIMDFRFVVENDPRHLDALREVRLYDMRQSASGGSRRPSMPSQPQRGSDKDDGFLNKFFKR
jgi:curved DNA-binding protein CbpA